MKTILGFMFNFVTAAFSAVSGVFPLLITGLTLAVGFFKFVNAMWGTLLAKIATLVLPNTVAASAISGLGFIDYVFPLHEMFTFIVAYCTAFAVCTSIRIIKSFVPTVS